RISSRTVLFWSVSQVLVGGIRALHATKQDVGGRNKPGHDAGGSAYSLQYHHSPIRCVERDVFGDLAFPAVAVRQQTLLVVVKLLSGFGREFEVRTFHDGVDRTGLLAQTAIDALHHVAVVAGAAAGGRGS